MWQQLLRTLCFYAGSRSGIDGGREVYKFKEQQQLEDSGHFTGKKEVALTVTGKKEGSPCSETECLCSGEAEGQQVAVATHHPLLVKLPGHCRRQPGEAQLSKMLFLFLL